MTTLVEFLLARIAEDEARVAGLFSGDDPDFFWGPDRIRAECEVKRQIVEKHEVWGPGRGSCDTCTDGDFVGLVDEGPCFTLRALAAVYADHPDYRQEWRP